MPSVTIHPPKTPITRGSNGIAKATLPNVCKMPGPPAPFVPTALLNIARSGLSPQKYSTTVRIEGHAVAIRGAMFASVGDVASKATGGGLISANTHGPAKFITPGTLTVKIQGKGVHLLGDPVLNNCGPGGNPPNTGATMTGTDQASGEKKGKRCSPACESLRVEKVDRDKKIKDTEERHASSIQRHSAAEGAKTSADSDLAARLAKQTKAPPSTDGLRKAVEKAAKALEAAAAYRKDQKELLDSLRLEQKVADDCGGGENWRIVCNDCKHEVGDFDVVTQDGRVKEVKSSASGFQVKRAQFDKLKEFVETKKLMGENMTMKVAVPVAHAAAVEAANPDLVANEESPSRVQGH